MFNNEIATINEIESAQEGSVIGKIVMYRTRVILL